MEVIAGVRVEGACVSAGRPHQVARMEAMCEWPGGLTWVVPKGQGEDYKFQGAQQVISVEGDLPNICGQRNVLLDWAFDQGIEALAITDDDTKQFRYVEWHEGTRARTRKTNLPFVVDHLLTAMEGVPEARLGGIAPTANWLYVCNGPRVKTRAFVQGNFTLIKNTPLRYDPDQELSEDYDYCLMHLHEYGVVCRDDLILGDYTKLTNSGGLQDLPDRAAANAASRRRLKAKWPKVVTHPHPKKGDVEVLIDWKNA